VRDPRSKFNRDTVGVWLPLGANEEGFGIVFVGVLVSEEEFSMHVSSEAVGHCRELDWVGCAFRARTEFEAKAKEALDGSWWWRRRTKVVKICSGGAVFNKGKWIHGETKCKVMIDRA